MAPTSAPVDTKDAIAQEVQQQLKPVLVALSNIGKDIADAMESHHPKKITFGRYDPRTIFHPDKAKGKYFRPGRDYYQNGIRMVDSNTFDKEVELLNLIAHSGTYIDGMVTVNVDKNGDMEVVSISWACHTADIRSEMKDRFRNFTDCLQQIVEAQAAELTEREGRRMEQRR